MVGISIVDSVAKIFHRIVEQFLDNGLCHGGYGCRLLISKGCFVATRLQFRISDLSKLLMERLDGWIDLKDL